MDKQAPPVGLVSVPFFGGDECMGISDRLGTRFMDCWH